MKGFHPKPNPCNDHDSNSRLPVESKVARRAIRRCRLAAPWWTCHQSPALCSLGPPQRSPVPTGGQSAPVPPTPPEHRKEKQTKWTTQSQGDWLPDEASTAECTLKALFVSAGIAMAAPLICSCIILDWSAPVGGDKRTVWVQRGFMMERLQWLSIKIQDSLSGPCLLHSSGIVCKETPFWNVQGTSWTQAVYF